MNKDITLQQYTALPDDEKGKYREVWQDNVPLFAKKIGWQDVTDYWYKRYKTYFEFKTLSNSFNIPTRQLFRPIEQPVEEKKD